MKIKAQSLKNIFISTIIYFGFACLSVKGQTFFESAEGEGVIAFRKETVSQIKLNLSSTSITYGYYYVGGQAVDPIKFLFTGEIKAKPNDDGIATLVKTGKLQPGLQINGAIGIRLNDILLDNSWTVLDIYLKPEYKLNQYNLFDSLRINNNEKPLYKTTKNSLGGKILLNLGASIFNTSNIFLGIESGIISSTNEEDLDEITIQTTQPYPGLSNKQIVSDIEVARRGSLQNVTKVPLKLDVVFDPNFKLNNNDATNIKLGAFGYFRTELKEDKNKNRVGFGLCLLSTQDPSRIFSSLGYEIPIFGEGVENNQKNDKGIVFASMGV